MNRQDELRYQVKLLKVQGGISSYKELAEDYLQVSYKGFLNWLNGQYSYGIEKQKELEELICNLSIPD